MTKAKNVVPVNSETQANAPVKNDLQALNEALALRAKDLEDAQGKIATLEAENLALKEAIQELNEQLKEKEKTNDELGKYPVLTYKGKKYELVDPKSRARFEGKNVIITKETLEADSKLLEHCVKKGFSCLREKGGR